MKRYAPGHAFLSWPVLAAALVLVFNDFYLKPHHPGWLSGKLSDFALCFFAPVWLYTLLELVYWLVSGRRTSKPWRAAWPVTLSCSLVGFWMAALQLWPQAAQFHRVVLEALMSKRMVVTPDPTDLISLVMLPVTWRFVRRVQALKIDG